MLLGLKVKNAAEAGRTITEVFQEVLKHVPEEERQKRAQEWLRKSQGDAPR